MDEEVYIVQNYDLHRLKKYLNYELSGSVLYFLSFQVFIFIFLASIAAVIFTPFMLRVLLAEKKKGWIIVFVLIVIIPVVVMIILIIFAGFSKAFLFFILGLFYFYFFLLRIEVNGWTREADAKYQYHLSKKRSEAEMKAFDDRFNL
ncbi:MAG: hypothetical protein JW995_10380 [Melioribacteraceae bacterium]|nr:hypothetical protein [Melioribacteraceae bacterium]